MTKPVSLLQHCSEFFVFIGERKNSIGLTSIKYLNKFILLDFFMKIKSYFSFLI